MIQESQIVLFAFPPVDRAPGKLRPALVLRKCPGVHDDWLICMISSQIRHKVPGMDEIVYPHDADFAQIGQKAGGMDYTAVAMAVKRFESRATENRELRYYQKCLGEKCEK